MATTTKRGANSTRASRILKQQQREWQQTFAECKGKPDKVKAAAKLYHDKYGTTPTARWHHALNQAGTTTTPAATKKSATKKPAAKKSAKKTANRVCLVDAVQ